METRIGTTWIPKQKYISFDVFDTLMKRSVAMPADLFRLVEQYCENIGMHIPSGFAQKRREAEFRAAAKKKAPVCLDEIYCELSEEFGTDVDKLKELELKFEFDGCRSNPSCADLFRRCVEVGKTVVLISDMYLSASFIGKMLEKCGIHGYKKLYVSCEIGAHKRDGSLFRAVLTEMGLRPSQLFHIGDNWKADYIRPILLGIRALHIDNGEKALCKRHKELPDETAFSYRTMRACVRNCSQGMTEYEKMGCRFFGPQLYGFSLWLLERLRENDIHDVYFMARDGYTMKIAFDTLGIGDIRTHYLYCSRRAYQVPMIWKHSCFDEVIIPFSNSSRMNCRMFLSMIGLSADDYICKARSCGVEMDRYYEKGTFFKDEAVRMFYDSIRMEVEKNSKDEYDALVVYLRSLDMQESIAVVDVGYQGSMQFALEELINNEGWNIKVKGFYAGTFSESPFIRNHRIIAEGYWFDSGNDDESRKIRDTIAKFTRVFETQYLGRHGSVERFEIKNNVSRPVFLPYENMPDNTETVNAIERIDAYQSAAVRFVRYMTEEIDIKALCVTPVSTIYDFLRQGMNPSLKEAQFWGDFRFSNYGTAYIAKPRHIFFYLTHWKFLKKDILDSSWKIGFMRRLFKIPLPYGKILEVLKKIVMKSTN